MDVQDYITRRGWFMNQIRTMGDRGDEWSKKQIELFIQDWEDKNVLTLLDLLEMRQILHDMVLNKPLPDSKDKRSGQQ